MAALTLRDRLSHLSFAEASSLLGRHGKQLLMRGGSLELPYPEALKIEERGAQAVWETGPTGAVSIIVLDPGAQHGLHVSCSRCGQACEHIGGLLSVLLERKSDLGLAMPPPDAAPVGSEAELVAQALAERADRAKKERMTVRSNDRTRPWTDYSVTNEASGKTYRVALRSSLRGESYCACPDFKISTLGTCKHVMKTLAWATKKFTAAQLQKPYARKRVTIHVAYGDTASLSVVLPSKPSAAVRSIVDAGPIAAEDVVDKLTKLEALGQAFFVTPDAEELIDRRLTAARMQTLVSEIRKAPAKHPLRTKLLTEPLLPYQLDGIAFAAGAGRAVLADEMGLGKTIQGVGVAELLAREVGISKVLVVCPASLKSQWRSEIARFSGRSADVVTGALAERGHLYATSSFFTICNYEQVLKDLVHIEKVRWDLIILDEGQRIKNWEAKTSRVIKGLASRFALVLTGTPLENRLDDLHSVVSFVDPHQLGPAFRFLHRHQRRDDTGKLVGFKNLDEVRKRLAPILLRRTRDSVKLELPPRTVETVRIAPSGPQKDLHDASMQMVIAISRKKHLTEMDLLRLRAALLVCRMAANGTFLVNKEEPNHSTKLERLAEIFDTLMSEPDRKVVLFSEWTTMLDLIRPLLDERKLGFVRLDGGVPQKRRAELVARFQNDPSVRFFLTTNAGSTGLNLQAANTVINVDLPWNPAVLEQRIARAHRMGQKRPVSVFVLVTEDTIEESLLSTLSSKKHLAMAALDTESKVNDVDVRSQTEDLKSKLEVLLGQKPPAPVVPVAPPLDPTVAQAGNQLVDAALAFLGALTKTSDLKTKLDPKLVTDERGQPRLSLALPSRDLLAKLLAEASALVARG